MCVCKVLSVITMDILCRNLSGDVHNIKNGPVMQTEADVELCRSPVTCLFHLSSVCWMAR